MAASRSIMIAAWVDEQEKQANFSSRVFLPKHALLHIAIVPVPRVLLHKKAISTAVPRPLGEVLQLLSRLHLFLALVALPALLCSSVCTSKFSILK